MFSKPRFAEHAAAVCFTAISDARPVPAFAEVALGGASLRQIHSVGPRNPPPPVVPAGRPTRRANGEGRAAMLWPVRIVRISVPASFALNKPGFAQGGEPCEGNHVNFVGARKEKDSGMFASRRWRDGRLRCDRTPAALFFEPARRCRPRRRCPRTARSVAEVGGDRLQVALEIDALAGDASLVPGPTGGRQGHLPLRVGTTSSCAITLPNREESGLSGVFLNNAAPSVGKIPSDRCRVCDNDCQLHRYSSRTPLDLRV